LREPPRSRKRSTKRDKPHSHWRRFHDPDQIHLSEPRWTGSRVLKTGFKRGIEVYLLLHALEAAFVSSFLTPSIGVLPFLWNGHHTGMCQNVPRVHVGALRDESKRSFEATEWSGVQSCFDESHSWIKYRVSIGVYICGVLEKMRANDV
jgi:hypothetical protein